MGQHDKAFRSLMKEKGVADALIRERLPPELARRMAGPPVLVSESFVDATLRGRWADVVLRVPLKHAADAFVYCVVEHKRVETPRALVQVLRYLTALYAWLDRTHTSKPLPPVVPLLIFNGDAPWRGPRRFRDVLDARSGMAARSLDFEITLLDVGSEPIAQLSKHPTLKGGLLGLRAAATAPNKLEPVLDEMLDALRGDASTTDRFLLYLSRVCRRDALAVLEKTVRKRNEKEPEMQTIAQYLDARGYRRGKRHGEVRGEAIGLRRALRRVLTKRFKRVPEDLEVLLSSAKPETLERWLDAAVTAKTVRSAFTEG